MKYTDYVLDTFVEHHVMNGLDEEESRDLFFSRPLPTVEKWLTKIGYDLNEYKEDIS